MVQPLSVKQQKATQKKRLHGKERLKRLNLEMLEVCRLKFDLIMCYKIAFVIVRVNSENLFYLKLTNTVKLYKHFKLSVARSGHHYWNKLF